MFDTILGIPVHPLVVHAVVVLTPLTALLLVLFVVSERLRSRIGLALPLLASVTFVSAIAAGQSGEALRERIGGGGDLVEQHAEIGETMPITLAATAALSWVLWMMHRRAVAGNGSGSSMPLRVLSGVSVLLAIALTVLVVLVGHSGAEAVWSGVGG
ncbi:hypothetical protein JQN72_14040 [Phycicoccus sp. CSK15P-2]|uniref:DUF2231 domain-containing protein n=1 Tax=Phycicoccus sp. CSK15P-2 TaxID=2807627 RepID=UPI00195046CE|nr:DUF2231 domain-containing protein [Phycicoccus sp. CSK15P-2]MBM6405362.1 hypothetical protein [Phycicoccus sp. CSK15P-2]